MIESRWPSQQCKAGSACGKKLSFLRFGSRATSGELPLQLFPPAFRIFTSYYAPRTLRSTMTFHRISRLNLTLKLHSEDKTIMRKFFIFLLLASQWIAAQTASPSMTGRWIGKSEFYGSPIYSTIHLTQQGDKLTGDFDGDKLEGTVSGNHVHFLAKDTQGGSEEGTATLQSTSAQDVSFTGEVIWIDGSNPTHPQTHAIVATLAVAPQHGTPQRREFTPTVFYRQFSAFTPPVMTVEPGETIHSTTVDAGGVDEKGQERVLGGNPQTGPFYVQGAMPGDTLVVHLTHLRLNRDWADSDDFLVGRALSPDWAAKLKDAGKQIRWHLDLAKGVAYPEKAAEHLTNYTIPLHPMLGCVATAARAANAAPGTGDSGGYGGNMDFNEVVEGNTLYLPVNVPGALLYFGDGHAAQGDGELNGNALETSMDVELTVDVISNQSVPDPRVESSTHIMAMGLGGSIEDALRDATANMAQWLTDDYKLTPSEVAQVLGSSAEYRVSELADRNAGIVLKINKERLKGLVAGK